MCDAAGAVRYLTLPISGELAGSEVYTLLRRHLGLSGTVLRRVKWLSDGITVDGARVNVRFRVAAGQVLSVRLSDPDSVSQPLPRPGPLDLVYEDEDLVVVNKAPGVLVHPSHGHFDDTVGNFLMARYRENREGAGFHPVHRLDKGTSGLLVVAKHPYGQEKLKSQLHTGAFRRIYLAVCDGTPYPAQGVIDAPIGRAPGSLLARRGSPPAPATGWYVPAVPARWWSCSWTPDAPTRSGSTWPTWAVPSLGTFSTVGRLRRSSPGLPSTPPGLS